MKVKKIITKTEPKDLEITGATLLSIEEYKEYKHHIKKRDYYWWMRSQGSSVSNATIVCTNGVAFSHGDNVLNYNAVVPVLKVTINSDFEIGDKFSFGGNTFTIISEEYALCDNNIGYKCFREDWKAEDANIYEVSDVKKFVDKWFERSVNE